MSDFQGEDLRYSLSFSKIKCEFVLIGSKLVSNRCVILSIFRVLISKNIVLTRAPPFNFPLVNIYQTSEFNRYFARKWRDLICLCPSIDGNGSIFKFIFENTRDTSLFLSEKEKSGRKER